ncbi:MULTISPECIES: tetratricopeptide repeat protein [unclassified Undibacterium]|uniref:tetratricopeptide repeat protein n=1 Tax=unclassified Undibacterium TaxID=2630295 RepID=UPI002AC9A405|nr:MULTISPECIES: tetratricopeptide repeat protein [unclassified Undibacterium]MEB0137414.1 tetratricopeptide repeat protein [Undibacterium sp. CCC2.1]MEB0170921.1 tetratricopeptide repeat protein [Undibacterium sp. CCC1.1]MEB0174873.1 tetratricopeptide repeat protein [Undibacterium sp. CCC3.4]MEB0214209.1 tetratricopeptide repeat protein [Undibacterium sp. 5I2]WPX44520.1 tetratricopeptide repeat protein [Undibacterium sp. CCC3.4]
MSELSDIRALLIEPHQGMRVSLHNMLNLCGITKIEHSLTAGTAVRTIQSKVFDLILCEYDLGVGQDGQQLLEDMRHHKLSPLSTIFIMVTAERSYAKVVSAAELAPSDYLLKPFTADMLLERVIRAIEKRKAFVEVYALMETGAVSEAITACHHGEREYPRYAIDFMRLRAELHVVLGEASEAEALYVLLFEMKAVAWARLGLAKTLFMQGKYQEAEAILKNLVAENNKFMDAYDWLAKTHEAIGELPEAKVVLDTAVAVSPHAVRRLRNLGRLAMETGDLAGAETAFKKVVTKAKFSEFRDPEDHMNLVDALVKKGDTEQAKSVIRDMEKNMVGLKKTAACRAISSAMVHAKTGDVRLSDELNVAVEAAREDVGLSTGAKLGLARSCLENNKEEHASDIVLGVMKNASNQAVMSRAMDVFEKAGKGQMAKDLAHRSQKEVMDLVAMGVQKAKQGDFRGSVDLMFAAARKSPDNPQVVMNAALAALKCLENLGWDSTIGEQARVLIEAGRRLDPMNPRLKAIRGLYDDLQKKYGMSATRQQKL